MLSLFDSDGKELFPVELSNINYAFDWKGMQHVSKIDDWFLDYTLVEAETEERKSYILDTGLAGGIWVFCYVFYKDGGVVIIETEATAEYIDERRRHRQTQVDKERIEELRKEEGWGRKTSQ